MGRITPELEKKILELYYIYLSYKRVADELGIDERTVKRVVEADRKKKAVASTLAPTKPPNHENSMDSRFLQGWAITRGELKSIYRAFKQGKRPSDIIAESGFDPTIVQNLYEKFVKDLECNFHEFQAKVLAQIGDLNNDELRGYNRSFSARDLKTDEMVRYVQRSIQILRFNVFKDTEVSPPEGWFKACCPRCGVLRAIVNLSDEFGRRTILASATTICNSCQRSEGLR